VPLGGRVRFDRLGEAPGERPRLILSVEGRERVLFRTSPL
jgi:hypothetical protein